MNGSVSLTYKSGEREKRSFLPSHPECMTMCVFLLYTYINIHIIYYRLVRKLRREKKVLHC